MPPSKKSLYQSNKNKAILRARPEEKEWLTVDNILSVFNENGELRDNEKISKFENMTTEDGEPRKDWNTLRMNEMNVRKNGRGAMRRNDSNWPIPPRYYTPKNVEYEQKIARIKKQYLNGVDNIKAKYEIIGDLMNTNIIKIHPITIKHGIKNKKKVMSVPNVQNNNKKTNDLKSRNKGIIYGQIGNLLKKKIERRDNPDRYKKIRDAIFKCVWNAFLNDKTMNTGKKIERVKVAGFVTQHFDGMFMVFSMQIT